jgi:8-amino-7-oxononanoate synthase
MSYLHAIELELQQIRDANRYREISDGAPAGIDFSSNDYLGLASEPQVVEALRRATRAGSAGARLLGGAHREHRLLEEELAVWLGRERVLLFSSGYHAALGAIPVLARAVGGSIASDELNHASLIDGVRLAKSPRIVYPHADFERGAIAGPALLVTESIFSMGGDAVGLLGLLATLGAADALLVDEAHALGVAGAAGAGLARELNDPRVVVLGTLSKAFGAHGGFIAGPGALIDLLVNRARTFIFDTALPPSLALAARVSLLLVRNGDTRRERLRANAGRLRAGLRELGFPVTEGPSPIVPVILGSEARALEVSRALLERGIVAPAVRPPTVPAGGSRLRLSVRSDHRAEQIDRLLEELATCTVTS